MSMAELMESITDELTEQLEHNAFAKYMNPPEESDELRDCRCIRMSLLNVKDFCIMKMICGGISHYHLVNQMQFLVFAIQKTREVISISCHVSSSMGMTSI